MTSAQRDLRFDGHAILITGAGRGLGREYALLLASRGAQVVVADNGSTIDGLTDSARPSEGVVAEITQSGGRAVAYDADLSQEDGARGSVAACLETFGRIDGIVHNAGFSLAAATIDKVSSAQFHSMQAINTSAAFWMINAAWPHMAEQRFGRIVLTASSAAFGAPNNAAYSAAKAALFGLGRSVAQEGESINIFTNIVAPMAATRITDRLPSSPFMDWFNATLRTELAAPPTAYLCHRSCNLNGVFLASAGGRLSQIRMQETIGDLGTNATIEDVRDRIDTVMAQTDHFFPINPSHRATEVARLLGYDSESDADPYKLRR